MEDQAQSYLTVPSKLLKFLEKQFGHDVVQNLKERAEMQRVRVWPLAAGDGD